MLSVGITGHTSITEATAELVKVHLRSYLRCRISGSGADFIGITCLARGVDQLFAQLVLDLNGKLMVIVPAQDYGNIPNKREHLRYCELLDRAQSVHSMPFTRSGPDAYVAASREMILRSEVVVAVWDGSPPDGRGGTSDAVQIAQEHKKEVVVIWPNGSERN